MSEVQAEWNFIFLIYADLRYQSNSEGIMAARVNELESLIARLTLNERHRVFVIKNVVTVNNKSDLEVINDRFTVSAYNVDVALNIKVQTVKKIQEKETVLRDYFRDIATQFPSKRTALFTWDHGSIFGIARRPEADKKPFNLFGLKFSSHFKKSDFRGETKNEAYLNPIVYRRKNSHVKSTINTPLFLYRTDHVNFIGDKLIRKKLSFDSIFQEPEIDMITNEMLARAIKNSDPHGDGSGKMHILCMMNCCMQNLHAQYALCDCVDFLVAPQSWIYYPGYDYKSIFNEVLTMPDISPKNLASLIIHTSKMDATRSNPLIPNSNSLALFAVDLTVIPTIVNGIEAALNWEIQQLQKNPSNIEAINRLFNYRFFRFEQSGVPPYCLIDLKEWHSMRIKPGYPTYSFRRRVLADKMLWDFQKGVINSLIGAKILSHLEFQPSGLCISLPNREAFHNPSATFVQLFYIQGTNYTSSIIERLNLGSFLRKVYK